MQTPLTLEQLKRGDLVSFEWSAGPAGDSARERGIRALGRVVTQEDLPHMKGTAVGVQLVDDPVWVIDPAFAMSKGKTFTLAS